MKPVAATPPKRAPRETLNLRIPAAERGLIDRAAQSSGKTRTDFILGDALGCAANDGNACAGRQRRGGAISEEARAFYLGLGLVTSPLDPMTLMTTLSDLRQATLD